MRKGSDVFPSESCRSEEVRGVVVAKGGNGGGGCQSVFLNSIWNFGFLKGNYRESGNKSDRVWREPRLGNLARTETVRKRSPARRRSHFHSPRRHEIIPAPVADGDVCEVADGDGLIHHDGAVDFWGVPLGAGDAGLLD